MANVLLKPNGLPHVSPKRRAYSAVTARRTLSASCAGGNLRTAVYAVPVYSTYRSI